jgi:hypothetical protein
MISVVQANEIKSISLFNELKNKDHTSNPSISRLRGRVYDILERPTKSIASKVTQIQVERLIQM